MGGGCDSPRSWERNDHDCPSLTSYTSEALKDALKIVLKKEAQAKKDSKEREQIIKENKIRNLKKELAELEKE